MNYSVPHALTSLPFVGETCKTWITTSPYTLSVILFGGAWLSAVIILSSRVIFEELSSVAADGLYEERYPAAENIAPMFEFIGSLSVQNDGSR